MSILALLSVPGELVQRVERPQAGEAGHIRVHRQHHDVRRGVRRQHGGQLLRAWAYAPTCSRVTLTSERAALKSSVSLTWASWRGPFERLPVGQRHRLLEGEAVGAQAGGGRRSPRLRSPPAAPARREQDRAGRVASRAPARPARPPAATRRASVPCAPPPARCPWPVIDLAPRLLRTYVRARLSAKRAYRCIVTRASTATGPVGDTRGRDGARTGARGISAGPGRRPSRLPSRRESGRGGRSGRGRGSRW